MSEYRIIEITYRNKEVRFQIEKKFLFLGWFPVSHYRLIDVYLSEESIENSFRSKQDAQRVIDLLIGIEPIKKKIV